jgi:hypothetical protein
VCYIDGELSGKGSLRSIDEEEDGMIVFAGAVGCGGRFSRKTKYVMYKMNGINNTYMNLLFLLGWSVSECNDFLYILRSTKKRIVAKATNI